MLKVKKVAVTGGLAAGKTTVCQMFRKLGAYVLSADEIVHQLLSPKTAVGEQVLRLFGPEIIKGNQLDRDKIAALSFSHPEKLAALEALVHPAVFDAIEKEYEKASGFPLFVVEIPLLYETGEEHRFDRVIAVVADETQCKERSLYSAEEFDRRMKRQYLPQWKAARSSDVIENNGTLEQLAVQVSALYSQLKL